MKKVSFISLSFLLIFTIANSLYSCRADELPEPEVPTFCDSITVNYNTNVKNIIDNKCGTCHNNGQNPGLGTFSQVSGSAERMMIRALDQQTMPPASMPALTQEEKDILSCWRNAGFPEN